MHSIAIAEFVLARFTEKERAEAIVGDLKEASRYKGDAWFWRSFHGVLFSCSWKFLIGYLAAAIGGGYLLFHLSTAYSASTALHSPNMLQQAWASSLAVLIGILSSIALFSAFRFGIQDILTRLASIYTILGIIAVSLWWRTEIVSFIGGAAFLMLSASIFFRRGRKGTITLGILIGMQALLWLAGLTTLLACVRHSTPSMALLKTLLLLLYFFLAAIICTASTWLHKLLLENHSLAAKDRIFS